MEIAGAALILGANVMVEILLSRRGRKPVIDAGSGAAILD
jgi:hypothetical protein